MPCLVPVILAGYLLTLHPNHAHRSTENGALVEGQTCEQRFGLHARASSSGLYGAGIHYGLSWHGKSFSLTFQPRAGLSYADHPVPELPMRTQFELGAQVLLGYDRYRLAVDYWHLSNAELQKPNTGLDMIGLMVGVTF